MAISLSSVAALAVGASVVMVGTIDVAVMVGPVVGMSLMLLMVGLGLVGAGVMMATAVGPVVVVATGDSVALTAVGVSVVVGPPPAAAGAMVGGSEKSDCPPTNAKREADSNRLSRRVMVVASCEKL